MDNNNILQFERSRTSLEVARNEYEDDNIAFMIITMVTKDGQYYILDSGEELDLVAISYFAEYYERLRKAIIQDMFEADEIMDEEISH